MCRLFLIQVHENWMVACRLAVYIYYKHNAHDQFIRRGGGGAASGKLARGKPSKLTISSLVPYEFKIMFCRTSETVSADQAPLHFQYSLPHHALVCRKLARLNGIHAITENGSKRCHVLRQRLKTPSTAPLWDMA